MLSGYQIPTAIHNGNVLGVNRATAVGVDSGNSLARAFSKRTAFGLCNGSTISGNTAEDLESLLRPKSAVNNVVLVNLGPKDTIISSFLGDVYDLSYAVDKRGPLRNEITMIYTHPANSRSAHITPVNSTTIFTRRDYTDDERVSYFTISAAAVEKVLKYQKELGPRSTFGENPPLVQATDAGRRQSAAVIINAVSDLFAPNIYQGEQSLKLGIVESCLRRVRDSAVPLSLCRIVNTYKTAIGEKAARFDDSRPWTRDREIMEFLVSAYVTETYATGFGLMKRGDFIPQFIGTSEAYLKNMITNSKTSENVVVVGEDGNTFPVTGYIFLSESAANNSMLFRGTRSGVYKGIRPIYLLPDSVFLKQRNIVRGENDGDVQVIMRNGKEDEINCANHNNLDNIPLVELLKENDPLAIKKITNITEMGAEILGDRGGPKLDDRLAQLRAGERINSVNVEKACQFFIHEGNAVVVDVVDEVIPRSGFAGSSDTTATGVHKIPEITRVSVGDIDNSNAQLKGWQSDIALSTSRSNFHMGMDYFIQKPVIMYTPEISGAKHVFGVPEMEVAFMQPYLFDISTQIDQFNKQLLKADALVGQMTPVKEIYGNILYNASVWGTKYNEYSNYKQVGRSDNTVINSLLSDLISIELHPFFKIGTSTHNGKTILSAEQRKCFGDIPSYVTPLDVHILRGNQLLTFAPSPETLISMNKTLSTAHSDIQTLEDAAIREQTEGFTKTLTRMLMAAFTGKDKDLISANVLENVLYPVLTNGNFKRTMVATTANLEFLKDTRAEWASMPDTSRVMFDNIMEIVRMPGLTDLLKVATIYMMFFKITPANVKATIRAGFHPCFTVDFMRRSEIFSSEMIYVKPKSMDMVLCAGPVKIEKDSNENLRGEMSARVRTTSNMFAGNAVIAPCALPNSRGSNMATMNNGRPQIAIDSITRSKLSSLNAWVREQNNTALTGPIVDTLADLEDARLQGEPKGLNTRACEAYIAIIRPVSKPTANAKPYIGKPRYVATPLPGSKKTPFQHFYESEVNSSNIYMSNLGGVYNMMYTPNNTRVELKNSEDRNVFRMDTTCFSFGSNLPVSDVTLAFEKAFNFSPETLDVLTENENTCLGDFIQPDMFKGSTGKYDINSFTEARSHVEKSLTERTANVCGRAGYCAPLTHYTDATFAEAMNTKEKYKDVGCAFSKNVVNHVVFSPFHVSPAVSKEMIGINQFPSIV